MRVLAIDPGSRVTGYAVLDGLEPADLVEVGRITGEVSEALAVPPGMIGPIREHLACPALAAWRRIRGLAAEIAMIVREHEPQQIVVEIPSGRAGTGSKAGASSSLAIYGMAAGYLLARVAAEARLPAVAPCTVIPVTERQWARGPKRKRQQELAAYYPTYVSKRDAGGDGADAIGLARWWLLTEQRGANHAESLRQG